MPHNPLTTQHVPLVDEIEPLVEPAREIPFVRKTADESVTSSTTLQDDNHLFLPVETNALYVIRATLFYSGRNDAATGGLKLAWSTPSGVAGRWAIQTGSEVLATHYARAVAEALTWSGTFSALDAGRGLDDIESIIIDGILRTTSSGTLQLRFAQVSGHATPTKLHTDSYLELNRRF